MLLSMNKIQVYADQADDIAQCNVGDSILLNSFLADPENSETYEIVESGTFHNGHAIVLAKLALDDECYEEENGDEQKKYWLYINDSLQIRCNLTEEFGLEKDYIDENWDMYGNCLVAGKVFLYRDGVHYAIFDEEKVDVKYANDGYYIYEIVNSKAYIHSVC